MEFVSIDPADGSENARFDMHDADTVEAVLAAAHAAHLEWRLLPIAERTEPLRAVGRLLRERKDEYGALMTSEMGKPITQAIAEAEKCAWVCEGRVFALLQPFVSVLQAVI